MLEELSKMSDVEAAKYLKDLQKEVTSRKKAVKDRLSNTIGERKEQRGLGAQLKRDNKESRAVIRDTLAKTQAAFSDVSDGCDSVLTDLAILVKRESCLYHDQLLAFVRNRNGEPAMATDLINAMLEDDDGANDLAEGAESVSAESEL